MFSKKQKKKQILADSGSKEATFVVALTETVLEMRKLAAVPQLNRTIAMH